MYRTARTNYRCPCFPRLPLATKPGDNLRFGNLVWIVEASLHGKSAVHARSSLSHSLHFLECPTILSVLVETKNILGSLTFEVAKDQQPTTSRWGYNSMFFLVFVRKNNLTFPFLLEALRNNLLPYYSSSVVGSTTSQPTMDGLLDPVSTTIN